MLMLWYGMHFVDEPPSNIAFGTTGDREIFPSHVPHSRFGADLNPITGAPNRGPGHYKVEEVSICFCLVNNSCMYANFVCLVRFMLHLLNF